MKVNQLKKTSVLFLAIIFTAFLFQSSLVAAQDGSPDLYNSQVYFEDAYENGETEEEVVEEESYIYEEQYFQEDNQYYEAEVKEDTSSVSVLTFNFLFYIVYKLKFSDNEQKQESSKTADD